jgi:hypothetical protein
MYDEFPQAFQSESFALIEWAPVSQHPRSVWLRDRSPKSRFACFEATR